MWLVKRTFCIPDQWNILTLIPVAILLVANMNLGYWIYVMKYSGQFFLTTIGTTAGVALLWAYRKLSSKHWARIAYMLLVVVVGYPLMGVYALVSALLMGVWAWRFSSNRLQNMVLSIVTILVVMIVPLMYYRFVYYHINIVDIYDTLLPDYIFVEDYSNYLFPYYLLVVFFLTFILFHFQYNSRPIPRWVGQCVLLVVLIACVWHFWYKDGNFHHELRMQRCIEACDWEGVIEEGRKQVDEPTRAIVMMRNLALSRLGRQCDEMYNFPKGSVRSNTKLPIFMFITVGRLVNYQYGLMNECHRICMEDGVEYGWSVELLQYMARAAIMSNEPQLARNYLNLLRQTHYYGDWADHMECLIDNPNLIKNDKEAGPITHMMQYEDIHSKGNGYVEVNLMTMLSHIDSDDPYFQEQAVLAAMWTRDSHNFWPRFDRYIDLHPDTPVPRIIQEAARLFGHLDHLPVEFLPFDKSVNDSFNGFMSLMEKLQGQPVALMKDFLYQQYGNTYYYEYFLQRDITYY